MRGSTTQNRGADQGLTRRAKGWISPRLLASITLLIAVTVLLGSAANALITSFDTSTVGNFTGANDSVSQSTVSICGPAAATNNCPDPNATEISWGTPAPSSMRFVPATASGATNNVAIGQTFRLGTLSHVNTVIDLNTSDVTRIDLEIETTVRDNTGSSIFVQGAVGLELDLIETVNAPCSPGCPDTVRARQFSVVDTWTTNQVDYQLEIMGFSDTGAPEDMNELAFVTDEDSTASTGLYGRVTVTCRPPVVNVANDSLPEGTTKQLTNVQASDPEGGTLTYAWTPGAKLNSTTVKNPLFTGLDDAVDQLTLTVTDDCSPNPKSASDTVTVTTFNVAPETDLGAPATINEHDVFTRTGLTYSDVGILDTHTATVDYGDGTGEQPLTLNPGPNGTGTYQLTHQYLDDNPTGTPQDTYTITVTITDDDGGATTETVDITVNNLEPTVEAGENTSLNEGEALIRNLDFDDIGTLDSHIVEVDFGEGDGFETVAVDAATKSFTIEHIYEDDDPTATPVDDYTVVVRVTDDDGGIAQDTFVVTVFDVAPELEITSPSFDGDLFAAPATINLAAPFTDPGVRDTFECRIDWDEADATNSTPEPDEVFVGTFNNGAGDCDATHTFDNAGVYTVTVTVIDDDTLLDSETRTIVVYDPSAGFVTGGGWYTSAPGAYIPDPTATGQAHFAFVSMYRKGRAEGNTQFQFQAGDLNFHSNDYAWLVVTGNGQRAQYKGEGTINGAGSYGFMLTAYDFGEPGSGTDQVRMKIWDKATGDVIYDNRLGSPEDVDQANPQTIEHGNIVIHTRGGPRN